MKVYIRRTYRREHGNYESYRDYLEWVVRKVGTGAEAAKRARAHFRHAGILGVPDN